MILVEYPQHPIIMVISVHGLDSRLAFPQPAILSDRCLCHSACIVPAQSPMRAQHLSAALATNR